MRLLVIDGNSIANRAFYGIKLLTTKDGRYTNAIYGFLNILLSLLKECQPDEVAVAFDLKAPTFRHKMYDATKPPATPCLRSWRSRCRCSSSCWQTLATAPLPPKAGKRTIFWARWPLPAPPARTTASLPPETGTACSW